MNSHIYTNPRYLSESWDSLRALSHAFTYNGDGAPLSLEAFQDLVRAYSQIPDTFEFAIARAMREHNWSTARRAKFLITDLLEGYEENDENQTDYCFSTGQTNPDDGKIQVEAALALIDKEDNLLPVVGSFEKYGLGEALFITLVEEPEVTDLPQPPAKNTIENNLHRFALVDRCLEALLAPVIHTTFSVFQATEKTDISDVLTASPEGEEKDIDKLILALRGEELAKGLSTILQRLITIRGIQWHAWACLCDDPEGAFDWLLSYEGPVFTTPMAAEIQATMDELHKHGKLPWFNFFKNIGAVKKSPAH